MHLQTAHLRDPPGRLAYEIVIDGEPAGDQGTGDHGSEALHGEDAVDRQPRGPRGWPRIGRLRQRGQGAAQIGKAGTRPRRDGMNRPIFQEGSGDEFLHLQPHDVDRRRIDQIRFRDDHEA